MGPGNKISNGTEISFSPIVGVTQDSSNNLAGASGSLIVRQTEKKVS